MKSLVVLLTLMASVVAYAGYEVKEVAFSGTRSADLQFVVAGNAKETPAFSIRENVVEVLFPNGTLPEASGEKIDYSAPHALLQSVTLFRSELGGVKARLVLNGSTESLKSRLTLAKSERGFKFSIAYPAGENSALGFLSEEQKPLAVAQKASLATAPSFSWLQLVLVLFVICGAGVSSYFFVRFAKKQGKWRGSRKFLIEQMAYCPMGQKSGVSLIRIGKEFVLVGVTPNQINFLSQLPKLEAQYEEETKFERGVFQEAVEEEFKKTRKSSVNA